LSRSISNGIITSATEQAKEGEAGDAASSSNTTEPRVVVEPDRTNVGIVHVRLNRPRKLNALDLRMFESLRDAIDELKARSSSSRHRNNSKWPAMSQRNSPVRVVIVSGNGRAFCSGLDVPSLFSPGDEESSPSSKLLRIANPMSAANALLSRRRVVTAEDDNDLSDSKDSQESLSEDTANLAQAVAYGWRELDAPVIAVIHGPCFGAGLQIALGADVRIGSEDAKLSVMEGKWGLIPDMSASVTLRELVRIDVAKELTYTGRVVPAKEALELGLVTRVAPTPERAMDQALELANLISGRSPDAVRLAKKLYQQTWVNPSERECLKTESDFQRKLIATWNQVAASSRNFGWKIPYF
jgi:enoyl-CoA hydratase/carnithine racemase